MAEGEGVGSEDRKPKSDEARSAFTAPAGIHAEAPEDDQPTSEFAVPDGLASVAVEPEGSAFATPHTYTAAQSPPAYTPGQGFPVVRMKESPGRTGCARCCACRWTCGPCRRPCSG